MWPRYYGPYEFTRHEAQERINAAMYAVVALTGEECDKEGWNRDLECLLTHGILRDYDDRKAVSMHPGLRDALNELDGAIREALESVFNEGQQQGRSIMLQLASGTLSMEDYNRRALKTSDKPPR